MPLFTTQNAAEMAQRSHKARRQRKLAEKEKPATPQPTLENADSYLEMRITRVRVEIEKLSDLLEKETDPQRIDRLCSGLAKLCEVERVLDNRPLPGSRRPSKDRSNRSPGAYSSPPGPELDLPQESMVVPSFGAAPPEPELDPKYEPSTPAQPKPAAIAPTTAPQRVSISVGIASKAPIPTKVQPVKPKELVWGPRGVPGYR